jgi:hypothetical protein
MMATTRPDSAGPYQADQMSPADAPCPMAMSMLAKATAKTVRIGSGGPCPDLCVIQGITAPQAIDSSGNSAVMSCPKPRTRAKVSAPSAARSE